ncbi:MAG: phosphoenolpyruvate synthase, partial [Nitrospirae bacterium]
MKRGRFIAWFNELNREDIPEVGGKCANLGELYSRVHMPVPEGFAITAEAYRYFLEKNNAFERINSILSDVDIDNPRSLSEGSEKVRKFIESLPIDERLE